MNYNFNMSKIYMNKLETKIKELQERIDKSIEYIEDRFEIDKQTGGYHLTHTFDSSNLCELYDILKGSDSNDIHN